MKKHAALFCIVFLCALCQPAQAFMSGRTSSASIDYCDFERDGDGFRLTLRNLAPEIRAEFSLLLIGIDACGRQIYRNRLLVDHLPAYGEVYCWFPGYSRELFDLRVLIQPVTGQR